ncbi:hypothetical protein [Streptomyces sp. NPDC051569]|uniref:hypothetical protein n=1 Tax=Streptomyces sp. NPDC051569 TaxID=3365661 RepID=UPI0037A59E87
MESSPTSEPAGTDAAAAERVPAARVPGEPEAVEPVTVEPVTVEPVTVEPVTVESAQGPDAAVPEAAQPSPAVPPRRRGRTALLIAAAALVGIVGGTATGYGIQAHRPPTALPPLSQPDLMYPAKPLSEGKAADPLSAKEDHQVRTSGDLRDLLIGKPSGARDPKVPSRENGIVTVYTYAHDFEEPDYQLAYLLEEDVRRIARVSWDQGAFREVNVELVQFRAGTLLAAQDYAEGQMSYMPDAKEGAGNDGDPIKGSGNGRYYLYKADRKPGYEPVYHARAVAQRGDIMFDIHVFDIKPISKKDIRTLAERQLERL